MANLDEEKLQKNKHDFFIQKRSAARDAFERPAALGAAEALQDEDPLLRELRMVFDWMARERNAEKIPSKDFKQRLPDIYRKFPQLGNNFKRMDANSDCWLEWTEFVTYCINDERLVRTLRRAASMTVYGVSKTGEHVYKDPFDPTRMCELGPSPPILPWELSHTIEWRIDGLKPGPPGKPLEHAGMHVRPGTSIASPPFRAAGITGFLRFWPSGYWTETQLTRKTSEVNSSEVSAKLREGKMVAVEGTAMDGKRGRLQSYDADADLWLVDVEGLGTKRLKPDNLKVEARGPCRPPSASAWCCIGACLPEGTHLAMRFFVGDAKSERRECYWSEGTHVHQLWGPKGNSKYNEVVTKGGKNEAMTLVVGIEIYRNLSEHKNTKSEHRLKAAADTDRLKRRPALKDPLTQVAVPRGSTLMSSSVSLPDLRQSPNRRSPVPGAPGSPPKLLAKSQEAKRVYDEIDAHDARLRELHWHSHGF